MMDPGYGSRGNGAPVANGSMSGCTLLGAVKYIYRGK